GLSGSWTRRSWRSNASIRNCATCCPTRPVDFRRSCTSPLRMPTDFSGLIGIDLGTTFSCAARLTREGTPQTIPNREGELITPRVVMMEAETVIVGREAKRSECVYPDRTAVCVKRDMGEDTYSKALHGAAYRPEILSAMILKRIKADAEMRFGPVRHA